MLDRLVPDRESGSSDENEEGLNGHRRSPADDPPEPPSPFADYLNTKEFIDIMGDGCE